MKKIVFILPEIKGGGAEKSVINLYKAIESISDYECHLIIFNNKIEYNISGIRLHIIDRLKQISKKGIARLTYRKKMAELIDQYIVSNIGNEVVVFTNMMLADKAMSKSKLEVYHVIRNSYDTALLSNKNWFTKLKIIKNISDTYFNHPLIFVSEAAQKSFNKSFNGNKDQRIIHNAIDQSHVIKDSVEYLINNDKAYLVHLGRFNRQKRHDLLLESFSKVKADVDLKLLGHGSLEGKIRDQISNLNLDGRVYLEGFKANPYPYILNASLVVLTSEFEGLPRIVMEAIALKKPLLVFDCDGGIRELINNECCIVPFGDTEEFSIRVNDALENPDKYKTNFKFNLSYPHIAAKYISLVESIKYS